MNTKVVCEHRTSVEYPSPRYGFAPSIKYPEYQWNDISPVKNEVYDMVRSAIHMYGFDSEHWGSPDWNPLKDIIKQGDTVLIKPNWVMHRNENKVGGLDCLFTNMSITRAIVDYVYLALGGTGKIFVADSPMPDCDFEQFKKVSHMDEMRLSCESRGIEIDIRDLRGDVVKTFSKERITTTSAKGIEVDLGKDSYFNEYNYQKGSLRYSFLDAKKMNEYYHSEEHHRYVISDIVLTADVIINLPKIKTHRKAGYTAALKNYIGICYRKEAIPHYVSGDKALGGDEFNGPRIIYQTESRIRDKENSFEEKQNRAAGLLLKALRTPFWMFRKVFARKYQGVGNWHGNDTIWRAILDINRIIYYADKNGKMQNTVQRKFFSLGDMIVAGQHNGPLAPEPKYCGCIVCSENPVAFDRVVLKLMGFDEESVPLFIGIRKYKSKDLDIKENQEVVVLSNEQELNNMTLANITIAPYGHFEPADGWDILTSKK